MSVVRFGDKTLAWRGDETLLDCLQRSGVAVPSSCRSGVCHSCLVKEVDDRAPAHAQAGLSETWKAQGLFLSCLCTAAADLNVALPADVSVTATCTHKERKGEDVVCFRLRPEQPFQWQAGQFANLEHDGLVRSYSIASLPAEGDLEFHVRKVGRMSSWLHDVLSVGDTLTIRGPSGDCFYVPGRPAQPLLLSGTGTGLAPLYAVARDALAQGHSGPIHLLHGGRALADLYMDAELRALAAAHSNFHYLACLTEARPTAPHHRQGRVNTVCDAELGRLDHHRVFVCGSPAMVKTVKQSAYKAGAAQHEILADAFVAAPPPAPTNDAQKKKRKSLQVLQEASPQEGKRPRFQKWRFAVQALVLTGFLTQGVLYYKADFRPLGNLLPFMAYDSLGHMMVSSALLVWGALFALAMVFGRFMCGWLCPLGFLQDVGAKLLTRFGVKLKRPESQPRLVRLALAALVVGHFVVMPLLAAPVHLWQLDLHYREPWLLGFPFRAGLFALDLLLVFVVIGIVLPLFFGARPYCKMVCETGYMLDRAASLSFGRIRRNTGFDQDTCLSCGKCTATCPQGISVHEEVNLFDRVVNTNCVSCLQCVDICPNDTIVYSLRKRVADTGRVAGYLASLNVKAADLPRHVVTGLGVLGGAYLGFRVLPPSYFHTYLLFASLGGLTGHLFSRLLPAQADARSMVERERQERVLPLTPRERLAAAPSRKRRYGTAAAMVLAYAAVIVAALAIINHLPPRITMVSEVKDRDPATRTRIYFGVPPTLPEQEQHRAFGSFHDYLRATLGVDAQVVGAETYGQLAQALEDGAIDAALLPAGTAAAVLGRQAKSGAVVDPIVGISQVEIDGRTTFAGAVMTVPGGPSSLADLRGKRLAITSLDSVSGFLAPMAMLRAQGVGALDMSEIVYAGTAQKALGLLAAGRVDAAAAFDGAIDRFKRLNPTTPLVTLETFDGLMGDVVLVRGGFLRREALRYALQHIEDPRVVEDLRVGSITAFLEWDPSRFATFSQRID